MEITFKLYISTIKKYNGHMENKLKISSDNIGNKEIMANNLKRLLDSQRLNPHQFSDIMGFKYTTVMNWMKANSYPRIDKIELIAKYFGVDKSDLVEAYNPIKVEQSSNQKMLDDVFSKLENKRQIRVLNFAKSEWDQQTTEKITAIDKHTKIYSEEDFERMAKKAVAFGGGELSNKDIEFLKLYLKNNTDRIKED
ncbi:helix-turn-helix domain-containing protein [Pseudolactococcus plantarum]|nr:helix-turn-helix transcriptional regulator [Lactococcus plantarum]